MADQKSRSKSVVTTLAIVVATSVGGGVAWLMTHDRFQQEFKDSVGE